jgi:hypothetical protein
LSSNEARDRRVAWHLLLLDDVDFFYLYFLDYFFLSLVVSLQILLLSLYHFFKEGLTLMDFMSKGFLALLLLRVGQHELYEPRGDLVPVPLEHHVNDARQGHNLWAKKCALRHVKTDVAVAYALSTQQHDCFKVNFSNFGLKQLYIPVDELHRRREVHSEFELLY